MDHTKMRNRNNSPNELSFFIHGGSRSNLADFSIAVHGILLSHTIWMAGIQVTALIWPFLK